MSHTLHPTKVVLFLFCLLSISCTKDSDLLYDYVAFDHASGVEKYSVSSGIEIDQTTNSNSTTDLDDSNALVTSGEITGVNFKVYGAVGDGVTDDTAAIQAALDNENNLTADAGATFLISRTINLNQSFEHTISWNGSTIITNNSLKPMIRVDKRLNNGGLTTMDNLLVNGRNLATYGVMCSSIVNFKNIDLKGFRQTDSSSPAGFYIDIHDDSVASGIWTFDGCDVEDVVGDSNGSTTDPYGAANGYLIYWRSIPSSSTMIDVKNALISDCWGEDAQNVAIFSPGIDVSYSPGSTKWTNVQMSNWERRSVKAFAGNNTFINCTFIDPTPEDPNLYSSNKSGMVVFGTGSGSTGGSNQIFQNCKFTSQGYDGRVIAANSGDVYFENCDWENGADLAFTGKVGNIWICSGSFSENSTIFDYSIDSYTGEIKIGTNISTAKTDFIKINPIHWTAFTCQ